MAEGSSSTPVCKFLYDGDRASIFQIPEGLVKRYGESMPSEATMRIDQSNSWKVKIEKFRGHYFFTDGWKKFAEEVDMETRDYLMFTDVGSSEFRVQPDECSGYKAAFNDAEDSMDAQEETSRAVKHWKFIRKLKKGSTHRLRIPKSFSDAVGMVPTRTMNLRNADGKKWNVSLTDQNRGYFSIGCGWYKFLIDNKVVIGSRLSFQFISSNIIDVRVVKTGNDTTQLFEPVRRQKLSIDAQHKTSVDVPHKISVAPEKADWEEVGRRLRFPKELKMHHAFTLDIPVYFATEFGLHKNRQIKLRGGEGREWLVDVTERGGRLSLSGGWHNFLIDSKMVVGSTVSFISTTDGAIEVQLVKKGPDDRALFKFVEKNEGRFELRESFDKTSDLTRGPEKFHSTTNIENEDHFVRHENGSCVGSDHADTDGEEAYHVERPWRFTVELKETHVYRLAIPKRFVVGTGISTTSTIKLKDEKGKEWPVHLNDKNCGQFSLGTGWYDFLVGKKVVVGSMMLFEFVSGSKNIIEARVVDTGKNEKQLFEYVKRKDGKEVYVSPTRDPAAYDSPYYHSRNSEVCDGSPDRDAYDVGRRWSFTEELKKKNVSRLAIPKEFAIGTGISGKKRITLKNAQGREWLVLLTEESFGIFAMTVGWYNFLVDNNVVVGSIMSFEFVPGSNSIVETRLLKIGPNETDLFKFVSDDRAQNNGDREGLTYRAEESCAVRSWKFTEELKEDNAYGLVIPKEFALGTGISRKTDILLKDPKGEEWPVRVTNKNCGVSALTAGWYDFLVVNNVVVGTIMSFKFVSGSDNTIEAQVVKIGEKEPFQFVKRQRGRDIFVSPVGSAHAADDSPYDCSRKSEACDGFTGRVEAHHVGRRWSFTEELKEMNAYGLAIPKEFAVGTGISRKKHIMLKDVQGREWRVLVTDKIFGIFAMTDGWYNFLVSNNVVVGSIMSFEFVSGSDSTIKTRLLKIGPNEEELFEFVKKDPRREVFLSDDHAQNNEDGDVFTNQAEASSVVTSLRFTEELKENNVYGLVIPNKFALGTGISRKTNIKLKNSEGSEWSVRVTDKNCGVFALTAGWYDFLLANNVLVGTIMSFKFVSGSDNTVEARVVKIGKKEPFEYLKRQRGEDIYVSPMECDHATDDTPNDLAQSNEEKESCTDRDESFCVGRKWRFTEELKQNNFHKLAIPTEFALGTGMSSNTNITLKDAEGEEWLVRVTEENPGQFVMSAGWYDFLVANKVLVGNIISFELVSASNITIEVRVVNVGTNKKELFKGVEKEGEKEPFVSHIRSVPSTEDKSSVPNVNGERKKSGVGKRFSFSKEVKKHHAYTLDISKYIAIKTGIARQKEITLLDGEGGKWLVQVLKGESFRFSSGWHEFLIGNKVVIGSTLRLEMRSANTIAIKIEKEGTDKKARFNNLIREGGKLVLPETNQTSDLATEPGDSHKVSDHSEVPSNSPVVVKVENESHFSEPENSTVAVRVENECDFPEPENALGGEQKWSFSKQLKKNHRYKLDLPRDFAIVLGGDRTGEIQLQVHRRKKWRVQVRYTKGRSYWISKGWVDFLVGNKVNVGSTISLEWKPNKNGVVGVKITDSDTKNKEQFVKGTIGRPRSS